MNIDLADFNTRVQFGFSPTGDSRIKLEHITGLLADATFL